jgi:hypothetical protein
MCEDCRAAVYKAVEALVDAWGHPAYGAAPTTPGAQLVARMLRTANLRDATPETAAKLTEEVNQILLDAYETQRRDAISICSSILTDLTMIKGRLLDEAARAGDKRVVNLQWDGQRNGFHMTGKDKDGNAVARFEAVAFGENPAQAAVRITLGHLGQIGEIHE